VSAEKQRNRFSEYISREWGRLVSSVRSWVADAADRDAEDIVQDVLTDIFEKADVTAPIANLSAYVYRALRNRVVDVYRARRETVSMESLLDALEDRRFEAAEEKEKEELRSELFAAIDGLSPDLRAVVVATELEGRKFRELSEEWGIPIGTLLARKHRAVLSLRSTLGNGLEKQGGKA
jgi:RNA polymerase sigma factor (sigma-70 family)